MATVTLAVVLLCARLPHASHCTFVEGWLPNHWLSQPLQSRCFANGASEVEKVNGYVDALKTLVTAQEEGGEAKVRSTFRRLARVMHPDVAGASVEAAENFRALVDAYSVVDKGGGDEALKAAQQGKVTTWADDVGPDMLSKTDKFDGRRRDKCLPGDVILFQFRLQDVEKFKLKGRCKWGLAVVTCDDGGFVHGQRLLFEDSSGADDGYQSGWLTTDDYEEELLIDPMTPIEVVASYKSRDGDHYQVTGPVDTSYIYTQWFGWD